MRNSIVFFLKKNLLIIWSFRTLAELLWGLQTYSYFFLTRVPAYKATFQSFWCLLDSKVPAGALWVSGIGASLAYSAWNSASFLNEVLDWNLSFSYQFVIFFLPFSLFIMFAFPFLTIFCSMTPSLMFFFGMPRNEL